MARKPRTKWNLAPGREQQIDSWSYKFRHKQGIKGYLDRQPSAGQEDEAWKAASYLKQEKVSGSCVREALMWYGRLGHIVGADRSLDSATADEVALLFARPFPVRLPPRGKVIKDEGKWSRTGPDAVTAGRRWLEILFFRLGRGKGLSESVLRQQAHERANPPPIPDRPFPPGTVQGGRGKGKFRVLEPWEADAILAAARDPELPLAGHHLRNARFIGVLAGLGNRSVHVGNCPRNDGDLQRGYMEAKAPKPNKPAIPVSLRGAETEYRDLIAGHIVPPGKPAMTCYDPDAAELGQYKELDYPAYLRLLNAVAEHGGVTDHVAANDSRRSQSIVRAAGLQSMKTIALSLGHGNRHRSVEYFFKMTEPYAQDAARLFIQRWSATTKAPTNNGPAPHPISELLRDSHE